MKLKLKNKKKFLCLLSFSILNLAIFLGSSQMLSGYKESKKNITPQSEAKKAKYYDLTANISEKLVAFPGDPQFKSEKVCSLEEGSAFHLDKIHLGNHTGTHIDFPAHVIKDGKTSNDYPIESLIGHCLIIEVPNDIGSILQRNLWKISLY